MAQVLDCQTASMPFTYLGLPMGTTRPLVKDFAPLIDRVERRLSATVSFLSYGDSLVLINSVLSSQPTYSMCTLVIPQGFIEVIDKAKTRCLWRKAKNKERVNSLASWEMICKPKKKEGLGVMDLQLQNKALLIKFLAKFYNNADVPWVALIRDSYYYHTVPHAVVKSGSFWCRGVLGLAHEWCKLATCQVGNGHSTLFWEDNWSGQVLPEKFPRLFSYAKNQMISVHDLMSSSQILDEFHLPLSVQAFHEFNEVQGILAGVFLEDEADMWIFSSNKGVYTSNSFYRLQFSHLENHIPSCWIWKSRCMSKHRFFAWLLLHDRFNTKDMIGRRNWKQQDNN